MAMKKLFDHSLCFDVVEEDNVSLFVERVPEFDKESNSWIPSKDFSYRVRETREVFNADSDLDAAQAYRIWRAKQEGLPSIQERIEKGKSRSSDSRCLYHLKNPQHNFVLENNIPSERRCKRCMKDILQLIDLLPPNTKKDFLDSILRELGEKEGMLMWMLRALLLI